jgi:uncharacterized 2Fe-2S/4Fe-4S cluster protein (DUF4445 family)
MNPQSRTQSPTPDTHRLVLLPSGRQGEVAHGTTLLEAARQLGVELEAICGGRQACGKCLVAPEYGQFLKHGITSEAAHITPPGMDEIAYAQAHGWQTDRLRMSCAACITGDLVLNVPDESLARKQVVRKEAGNLSVEIDPAVQLAYAEVEAPTLGGASDDRRLCAALADQCDLPGVTLDALLLREVQKTLRAGKFAVTATVWDERRVIRLEPGYVDGLYGLAFDVGTTTVVCHLCDLRTGALLATTSTMNPQVRYGEDIMSRVSYAREPGGLGRLHHAIVHTLDELTAEAAQMAQIAPSSITDCVLVGNTIMHHLLLGIDPFELGQVPFTLATDQPLDVSARDLGLRALHPGARAHLLPPIAGYVGADATAVLLAEYPLLDERVTLIVDVGTNAEIVLATRDRILATSSPTGPAFEGAQIAHGQRAAQGAIERFRFDAATRESRYRVVGDPRWSDALAAGERLSPTGICGSGIIEIIAELFHSGLIAASGRFPPTVQHPRARAVGNAAEYIIASADEAASGRDIVLTQQDIRNIQLAKAALYAGARLLMDHMGVTRLDRIHLAGAFGSYIDPLHALMIGLIPDCDLDGIRAVGNAAGDGARLALLNRGQRRLAAELARRAAFVETAAHPHFHDYFVDAIAFPHAHDPFPQRAAALARMGYVASEDGV